MNFYGLSHRAIPTLFYSYKFTIYSYANELWSYKNTPAIILAHHNVAFIDHISIKVYNPFVVIYHIVEISYLYYYITNIIGTVIRYIQIYTNGSIW